MPDNKVYERKLIKKLIIKAKKRSRRRENAIFLNAGVMGIFGWHICVPVILGVILGIWLDKIFATKGLFVIILILFGLTVGIYNAYRWLKRNVSFAKKKEDDGIVLESEKETEKFKDIGEE